VESLVLKFHAALVRYGARIAGAKGWRRFLFAFAAGLLSALAFAPFGIFPALLFAYGVLVLLIDGAAASRRPLRSAAFAGWAFGFGQFLAGLYWVGYAFTVDASAHAWQIPFVAVLLPGGLALFPALACALCAPVWRPGSDRIFLFAALYAVCEWLRGHVLTGFPWNLAAYAWGAAPGVMQSAAVFGAYGLTLLTLLLGASFAEFASPGEQAPRLPAALAALFALLWLGGEARMAWTAPGNVPGVQLRIVQPNVPQAEKYPLEFRERNWMRLVKASAAPARIAPTHILWPEAAPPFLLARVPEALDEIAVLTPGNRVLMTGAVRVVATANDGFRAFNSFYIFSHGARAIGVYDKFHLVPFGEYLPLPGLLHALGITKLVAMPDGFDHGPGPITFPIPDAPPVGPLICYEIAFPGAVVGAVRPGWLANVTDDSWFGPSTGPYQHLLMVRLRAIEEGLPVARAANTGISAVIDPLGRVTASLALGRQGILDSALPRALPITPYGRLGDVWFVLLLVPCILWGARKAKRSGREQAGRLSEKSFSQPAKFG